MDGIWNPFPVPTPNIQLPPDSPSLRPRADIQDPAYGVPPAITQQINRTVQDTFNQPHNPAARLRGIVFQVDELPRRTPRNAPQHAERTTRNIPEVVTETPRIIKMAETNMSPIGIANVRITKHPIARASPDANSM